MSSTFSAVLVPSASGSNEPACAPLHSAKSTSGAEDISRVTGQEFRASQTCAPLALNNSPAWEQSTLFAEVSPAKTSAKRASASASKASEVDCGSKCCGWCASCDPVGSLLRTSLRSDIEAMTGFAPTWQRSTTPAGHSWWQLSTSELRKNASARGLWQTPTTRDYKGQSGMGNRMRRGRNGKPHVANLCDQLVDCGRPDLVRSTTFREWLMGLPIGFTDSKPLATPSSHRSPSLSAAQSCA